MSLSSMLPWARKSSAAPATVWDEMVKLLGLQRTAKSGVAVTLDSAVRVATVFACARVISQGLAQVPLKIYSDPSGTNKRPAVDHPLYYLLHTQPNEWQTAFEFRETIGIHLFFCHRAYVFKNVVGGRVEELIALDPTKVTPKRADDGTITYRVTGANGQQQEFGQSAIWHLRGPSWNGWEGMDALNIAREAIGLSISAEELHSDYFRNGVHSSGAYSVEGTLDEKQYKALRKFIADNHLGANRGLPMILDRSAKWLQQAMTGVDAQHLETRRFQVEEVCRAFGVMPIMVGHSDKAVTYASAEQMFIAHVVFTMMPWYTRVEQSIDAHLLGRKQVEAGMYARHTASALMRGDMKTRGEFYARALGSGGAPAWMTQDEVRGLEELPAHGGAAAELPKPTNAPAVQTPAPGGEPRGD